MKPFTLKMSRELTELRLKNTILSTEIKRLRTCENVVLNRGERMKQLARCKVGLLEAGLEYKTTVRRLVSLMTETPSHDFLTRRSSESSNVVSSNGCLESKWTLAWGRSLRSFNVDAAVLTCSLRMGHCSMEELLLIRARPCMTWESALREMVRFFMQRWSADLLFSFERVLFVFNCQYKISCKL